MEKEFELCLILGRYNHFHSGHRMIIDMARKLSKKTLILIGSSQEFGTIRNPYKVELRRKIIEEIYGQEEDVIISSLKDLTNENDISYEWGDYLLTETTKITGTKPDLMVYGKDESRKGWFREETVKDMTELVVSREKMNISATKLRSFLVADDFESWSKFVPEKLHKYYQELRENLLKVEEYKYKAK